VSDVTLKTSVDSLDKALYIGPKGGKWADAKHTIPWKPEHGGHKEVGAKAHEMEHTSHLAKRGMIGKDHKEALLYVYSKQGKADDLPKGIKADLQARGMMHPTGNLTAKGKSTAIKHNKARAKREKDHVGHKALWHWDRQLKGQGHDDAKTIIETARDTAKQRHADMHAEKEAAHERDKDVLHIHADKAYKDSREAHLVHGLHAAKQKIRETSKGAWDKHLKTQYAREYAAKQIAQAHKAGYVPPEKTGQGGDRRQKPGEKPKPEPKKDVEGYRRAMDKYHRAAKKGVEPNPRKFGLGRDTETATRIGHESRVKVDAEKKKARDTKAKRAEAKKKAAEAVAKPETTEKRAKVATEKFIEKFGAPGKGNTPNALRRRAASAREAGEKGLAQAYENMASYVSARKTQSETGGMETEIAALEQDVHNALHSQVVTPVGGLTPGGYRKVAEGEYVKEGPAKPEKPKVAEPPPEKKPPKGDVPAEGLTFTIGGKRGEKKGTQWKGEPPKGKVPAVPAPKPAEKPKVEPVPAATVEKPAQAQEKLTGKTGYIARGGKHYVDSDFVNASKAAGDLKHEGFGDFSLKVGDKTVHFERTGNTREGFSGREHEMRGHPEALHAVLSKLGHAGLQPIGEKKSEPGFERMPDPKPGAWNHPGPIPKGWEKTETSDGRTTIYTSPGGFEINISHDKRSGKYIHTNDGTGGFVTRAKNVKEAVAWVKKHDATQRREKKEPAGKPAKFPGERGLTDDPAATSYSWTGMADGAKYVATKDASGEWSMFRNGEAYGYTKSKMHTSFGLSTFMSQAAEGSIRRQGGGTSTPVKSPTRPPSPPTPKTTTEKVKRDLGESQAGWERMPSDKSVLEFKGRAEAKLNSVPQGTTLDFGEGHQMVKVSDTKWQERRNGKHVGFKEAKGVADTLSTKKLAGTSGVDHWEQYHPGKYDEDGDLEEISDPTHEQMQKLPAKATYTWAMDYDPTDSDDADQPQDEGAVIDARFTATKLPSGKWDVTGVDAKTNKPLPGYESKPRDTAHVLDRLESGATDTVSRHLIAPKEALDDPKQLAFGQDSPPPPAEPPKPGPKPAPEKAGKREQTKAAVDERFKDSQGKATSAGAAVAGKGPYQPGDTLSPKHNSAETAYVVDDYPYGRKTRTQMRYWLETKKGRGTRMMSQTKNPKTGRWNKPKASTYSGAAVMKMDEKGHIKHVGVHMAYSTADQKKAFYDEHGHHLPEHQRIELEGHQAYYDKRKAGTEHKQAVVETVKEMNDKAKDTGMGTKGGAADYRKAWDDYLGAKRRGLKRLPKLPDASDFGIKNLSPEAKKIEAEAKASHEDIKAKASAIWEEREAMRKKKEQERKEAARQAHKEKLKREAKLVEDAHKRQKKADAKKRADLRAKGEDPYHHVEATVIDRGHRTTTYTVEDPTAPGGEKYHDYVIDHPGVGRGPATRDMALAEHKKKHGIDKEIKHTDLDKKWRKEQHAEVKQHTDPKKVKLAMRRTAGEGVTELDTKHTAGQWSVHESVTGRGGEKYAITHRPSGLTVTGTKDVSSARALANKLHAEAPEALSDLGFGESPKTKHRDDMEKVGKIVGRL